MTDFDMDAGIFLKSKYRNQVGNVTVASQYGYNCTFTSELPCSSPAYEDESRVTTAKPVLGGILPQSPQKWCLKTGG